MFDLTTIQLRNYQVVVQSEIRKIRPDFSLSRKEAILAILEVSRKFQYSPIELLDKATKELP